MQLTLKCVAYPGTNIHESEYYDSKDMTGRMDEFFENNLSFVS